MEEEIKAASRILLLELERVLLSEHPPSGEDGDESEPCDLLLACDCDGESALASDELRTLRRRWRRGGAMPKDDMLFLQDLIEREKMPEVMQAIYADTHPLHYACGAGDLAAAKAAVAAGHALDAVWGEDESQPIHEACSKGHKEIAQWPL